MQNTTLSMANIMVSVLAISGFAIDKFINNEMVPGPAKRGIANGLNAMSSLSKDSFIISPFTSLLCFEFSNKNPDREIIIPPAILRALIEIPKNVRIYRPAK